MIRGRSRYLLAAGLVLVALALQVSALPLLRLPWATPDLLLVVVVSLALAYDEFTGMIVGFAAGFALDVVPPADHAIGRTAFVLCLVGYLAGRYRRLAQRSAIKPVLLVGLLSVLSVLLQVGLSLLIGDRAPHTEALWPIVVGAAGYAMLLSPFVMPAVLGITRWLDRRRVARGALDPSRLRGAAGVEQDDSVLVR
jgi:rod shape-determining protein MreD